MTLVQRGEICQTLSDYAERFNVAAHHADLVAQMRDAMATHQAGFQPAVTQR